MRPEERQIYLAIFAARMSKYDPFRTDNMQRVITDVFEAFELFKNTISDTTASEDPAMVAAREILFPGVQFHLTDAEEKELKEP